MYGSLLIDRDVYTIKDCNLFRIKNDSDWFTPSTSILFAVSTYYSLNVEIIYRNVSGSDKCSVRKLRNVFP
jgi:hypothetical protein